jgi:hypothetical protein
MCDQCNSMRTGDSWANFLARYKLKNICDEGNGWRVESASGSTYHVASKTFLDEMGCMEFRMTCDCPARKQCRHISAVMDMRHAEELAAAADGDPDGIEMLERTQF